MSNVLIQIASYPFAIGTACFQQLSFPTKGIGDDVFVM